MAVAQRVERLEARVTQDQKELFKEAAEARGLSLTDFVVVSVRDAAVATLSAKNLFEISRQDQNAFVEALIAPPQVNDRLRSAAERHGFLKKR